MKDFLLICDKNCATYKEVFPLFKQGIVSFGSPVKEYEGTDRKFGNHGWITTFPVPNKKKLVLTATYDPDKYPKYDNYDAIEVSRVKNIPWDYDGTMGVPITILDYDLDNVEIVDLSRYQQDSSGMSKEFVDEYYRQGNTGQICEGHPDLCFYDKGKAVVPYMRVLIKKNFKIVGSGSADDLPEGWKGVSKEFVDLYYSQGNTGIYKEGNRLEHYIKDGKAIIPYKRVLIKKTLR